MDDLKPEPRPVGSGAMLFSWYKMKKRLARFL